MVVMRRIVDDTYAVKYPPFLSAAAKVGHVRVRVRLQAGPVAAPHTARHRVAAESRACARVRPPPQDFIQRLLERKPARRLGMLAGRSADVRRHRWFDGFDWAALEARRVTPPRRPRVRVVHARCRQSLSAAQASRSASRCRLTRRGVASPAPCGRTPTSHARTQESDSAKRLRDLVEAERRVTTRSSRESAGDGMAEAQAVFQDF
jgi:hypothetical protein